MAVKVKQAQNPQVFNYVAHVHKDRGGVLELAGSRLALDSDACYDWLALRAKGLDGRIVAHTISPVKEGVIVVTKAQSVKMLKHDTAGKPDPKVTRDKWEGTHTFGMPSAFGEFTQGYTGAALCTYKVTEE